MLFRSYGIFFNDGKGATKLDKADLNVESKARQETDISIRVCFTDLPEKIVIDATNETSLSAEYLLNSDGLLEVVKRYPNAGTAKVFICAMHPTNPECADLLSKKDSDLRKIIETRGIPCGDKTRNSAMRTAIWSYYGDDLQVNSVELDITKGDAKPIWEKLQKYLPVYSLFQADRKNSDSDSEVQDPLHAAVKEILQDEDISQTLDHVAEIVEGKLQEVATRTLEKLREMSPDISNTLSPVIPPASSLKWADVFKSVTISGDESIPINKRGSGSKRLILLNFFRAEVERRKDEANAPGIIYAIEEPETSQHSENQKKLINALIALSTESNVQVIVTTHSAVLVNALDFKNIRLICADGSQKRVEAVRSGQLPLPHTKMLYGTPIDPKETQVLNTSVEDTKASSMRNALIVAYDANKAVNYSDCYALTENSLFYEADKDCTNFVSQCVWAGYGGWVNGDETANAQNIAAHYRMYHHNNSDWYTTSWFAHKNGGSSPWESATSHGNFALGNTGSGLGPFGLGSTTAVLYSNYDASSIQRGDVVQLGRSANDIRHSVIVRTAGSSFENIFVNSHNSKHYNYPLSKYFETYSYIRVIHYRPAFFAN